MSKDDIQIPNFYEYDHRIHCPFCLTEEFEENNTGDYYDMPNITGRQITIAPIYSSLSRAHVGYTLDCQNCKTETTFQDAATLEIVMARLSKAKSLEYRSLYWDLKEATAQLLFQASILDSFMNHFGAKEVRDKPSREQEQFLGTLQIEPSKAVSLLKGFICSYVDSNQIRFSGKSTLRAQKHLELPNA